MHASGAESAEALRDPSSALQEELSITEQQNTSTPLPDADPTHDHLVQYFNVSYQELLDLCAAFPDPTAYKSIRQVSVIISVARALGLSRTTRTVTVLGELDIGWDDVIRWAPGIPLKSFKNIRTAVEKVSTQHEYHDDSCSCGRY